MAQFAQSNEFFNNLSTTLLEVPLPGTGSIKDNNKLLLGSSSGDFLFYLFLYRN